MTDPNIHKTTNIVPRVGFTRSNSGQGQTVISPTTGGRTVRIGSETVFTMTGISPQFSSTATRAIKESRDKDKKDLQDLNDRFATYIEKVRFLEAQNRKLTNDLENLRNKWGKETSSIKGSSINYVTPVVNLVDM